MSVCFVCCRVFSGVNGEKEMWKHVTSFHVDKTPEPKHMCKICGQGFTSSFHLKRHIIYKHYQQGLSSCTHCTRTFKSQRSLQIHLCMIHSVLLNGEKILEKKYPCSICGVRFGILEAAKRHNFYCKKNRDLIQTKGTLERKRTISQKDGSDILGIASTSNPENILSKIDELFASNEVSVLDLLPKPRPGRQKLDKSCIYCQQVFASMQSLKRHIQKKHPEKMEEANRLGKTYSAIDSSNLPYVCLDCGRRVANRAALTLHRRRVHEKKNDHTCNYCYRSYPIASELRKHMKRAHEERLDPERMDQLQKVVLEFLAKEEHGAAEVTGTDDEATNEQLTMEDIKPMLSEGADVETFFPVEPEEEEDLFVKQEIES